MWKHYLQYQQSSELVLLQYYFFTKQQLTKFVEKKKKKKSLQSGVLKFRNFVWTPQGDLAVNTDVSLTTRLYGVKSESAFSE